MKPDLSNGYIKIANEIVEALINFKLSGQELRAVLFVIRKTYGFNKKEDYIALSQFMKNLNISKVRASQVINALEDMNVLTVKENINGLTKKYLFNKYYKTWTPLRKNDTVKEKRNNRKGLTKQPLRKNVTTKDTITKDNTTKDSQKRFRKPSVEEIRQYCEERVNNIDAQYFFDSNETKGWKVGKTQTPMKDWKAAIRTWEKNNKKSNNQSGMDKWLNKE